MFANLKNKINEVKASQPFQQFANAAQAAVSSSSNTAQGASETTATTTNENFFSITEEDTPQNSPNRRLKSASQIRSNVTHSINHVGAGNATNSRTRRLSNSSFASDVSFRLPSYDGASSNYLQSDLDISASEVEESATTMDTVTKEQLYHAYKKSLDRYHKYRCRYTDLVKQFKDLERDSSKARSVLVETQEKAIRRINELREQCALEQQAKAHIEQALRMEIDDMQCKMETYETKLNLMNENASKSASVAENSLEGCALTCENDGHCETIRNLRESFQRIELQLKERNIEIEELTRKQKENVETIEELRRKEEENVLLIAQTKLSIHEELDGKDSEIKSLKEIITKLEHDFDNAIKDQAETMVKESIALRQQLKELKIAKQEADARAISTEHKLRTLKEKYDVSENAVKDAEKCFQKVSEDLKETQEQQNSNIKELTEQLKLSELVTSQNIEKIETLENEKKELEEQLVQSKKKLDHLEKELQIKNVEFENELQVSLIKLENERDAAAEIELQNCMQKLRKSEEHNEVERKRAYKLESELKEMQLKKYELNNDRIDEHKELSNQIHILKEELKASKEQLEQRDTQIVYQEQEIKHLRESLKKQDTLKENYEMQENQSQTEIIKLRQEVSRIVQDISQMEQQLSIVKQSHGILEEEKLSLESKIEHMQKQQNDLNEVESKLADAKVKLQTLEKENLQLANKMSLLNDEKVREAEYLEELQSKIEMQCRTIKSKEDMLHEMNSAAKILEDKDKLLEEENENLKQKLCVLEKDFKQMKLDCLSFKDLQQKHEHLKESFASLQSNLLHRQDMVTGLEMQLQKEVIENSELQKLKETVVNLQTELKRSQTEVDCMRLQECSQSENILKIEKEMQLTKAQLQETELREGNLSNDFQALEAQHQEMQTELKELKSENNENIGHLRNKEKYEQLQIENEFLNKLTKQLQSDLELHKASETKHLTDFNALKEKLSSAQCELYVLQENTDKHNLELEQKANLFRQLQMQCEKLKESKEQCEEELERQNKHAAYINERNDNIQKELLQYQQRVSDLELLLKENNEKSKETCSKLLDLKKTAEAENQAKNDEINSLRQEIETNQKQIEFLQERLSSWEYEQKNKISKSDDEVLPLSEHLRANLVANTMYETSNRKHNPGKISNCDVENTRRLNESLQQELEDLKHKSSTRIAELQHEMEDMENSARQMDEKIKDFAERLHSSTNLTSLQPPFVSILSKVNTSAERNEELEDKLKQIMQEVNEVSERNFFLEQKCENFLMLERSNERLKSQNAKLARQLDETLVSLQHNEAISANTEFEYLKNIMFQYLTGASTGNNETLVKVISAVLKFSPQQTQVAIEKEHQRRSLLNKIL